MAAGCVSALARSANNAKVHITSGTASQSFDTLATVAQYIWLQKVQNRAAARYGGRSSAARASLMTAGIVSSTQSIAPLRRSASTPPVRLEDESNAGSSAMYASGA